jgi:hypothetical protein
MIRMITATTVLFLLSCTPARPNTSSTEPRFREIYKELVETNTSLSAGEGSGLEQHVANNMRGDDVGGRACDQRPAAACPG